MFTQKEFTVPERASSWEKSYDDLVKAIKDHFSELNRPGVLEIFEATIRADSGVQFPATAVDSSDANTLDDYEEGSWTPVDTSGASLSFSSAAGSYTKVGNVVTAWGQVTYPATASGANAKIGGLPFTVKNSDHVRGGFVSFSDEATLTSVIPTNNATEMQLIAGTAVTTNAVMSGNLLYFVCLYPAA